MLQDVSTAKLRSSTTLALIMAILGYGASQEHFCHVFYAVVRGILILCKLVLVRFSTFSETRCNSVTPVCRSAVLPVSYAFATTGIAAGLAISMVRFMPFQSLYIVYFIKVSSLFVCPRENNHQRYRTRE